MRNLTRASSFLALASLGLAAGSWLAGCQASGPFTEPMVLGGETISAANLNRGHELYMMNCYACHGEQGNGRGPAAAYLRPPPRDFRSGLFKFGLAVDGLPHTEDLVALVRHGLTGTAMLPWDVPAEQLTDIINYIKTFSWQWRCDQNAACPEQCARTDEKGAVQCYKAKKLGKQLVVPPDPWAGREPEALTRGESVYHIQAQCRKCHPSYVTQERLYQITRGDLEWAYGELAYRSALRRSDEYHVDILPIDFLYHNIKNLRDDTETAAEQREKLFKVIGAGVNGAAMPTWKGAITDDDLWALAYYVQHLHALRGTPEGFRLRQELEAQTPFVPPGQETVETPPGGAPAPAPAPGGQPG